MQPSPALCVYAFLVTSLVSCVAWADLRVVTWNTLGESRTGTSTVLEAIGLEEMNGVARPIDVLSLQEQNTSGTDTASIVATLNALYGAGVYAAAPTPNNAQTNGAGLPGLVYNTQTIDLLDAAAFGSVNTSAQARSTLRYLLRPDGYGSDFEFYVYSNHYKASTSSSDLARRQVEAAALRADLDALGEGTLAILTGDFNIRSSSESSYQTLLAAGPGQAFDPIATPGTWHNSSSLRHTHTQSPVTSSNFSGQVTGGVDDRFDFQLVTGELLDGIGLDYIDGSYRAFGNNGTHACCNSPLTGTGASPTVLDALRQASDHLPVVADYALPALSLPGDFNFDELVTAADYSVWRDSLADDAGLYDEWLAAFGGPQPAAVVVSVPEPSTTLLLLLGASMIAKARRKTPPRPLTL